MRERHHLQIISTKVNEGRKYSVVADESLDRVKLIRVFGFVFSLSLLSLLASLQDPIQEVEMTAIAQSLLLGGPQLWVIFLAV